MKRIKKEELVQGDIIEYWDWKLKFLKTSVLSEYDIQYQCICLNDNLTPQSIKPERFSLIHASIFLIKPSPLRQFNEDLEAIINEE